MDALKAQQRKQIALERRFWRRYSGMWGWRLYAWSHMHSATFQRPDGSLVYVGDLGSIRCNELDVVLALKAELSASADKE